MRVMVITLRKGLMGKEEEKEVRVLHFLSIYLQLKV